MIGVPSFGSKVTLDAWMFSVIGSYYGSPRLHYDMPRIIDLYMAGRLKLDELVTETFALADINASMLHWLMAADLAAIFLFTGFRLAANLQHGGLVGSGWFSASFIGLAVGGAAGRSAPVGRRTRSSSDDRTNVLV